MDVQVIHPHPSTDGAAAGESALLVWRSPCGVSVSCELCCLPTASSDRRVASALDKGLCNSVTDCSAVLGSKECHIGHGPPFDDIRGVLDSTSKEKPDYNGKIFLVKMRYNGPQV